MVTVTGRRPAKHCLRAYHRLIPTAHAPHIPSARLLRCSPPPLLLAAARRRPHRRLFASLPSPLSDLPVWPCSSPPHTLPSFLSSHEGGVWSRARLGSILGWAGKEHNRQGAITHVMRSCPPVGFFGAPSVALESSVSVKAFFSAPRNRWPGDLSGGVQFRTKLGRAIL